MDEWQLTGKQPTFRRQRSHSNPNRLLVYMILLVASLFLWRAIQTKEVVSPFAPTATPTRSPSSFIMEGQTHFVAGDMNRAVEAYKKAVALAPGSADILSELTRIQVYSSTLLTNDSDKWKRMQEALASADQAIAADSENSMAHAVRAFTLDWMASSALAGIDAPKYLAEAETEVIRALQLDNQNPLGYAYYAEILTDQQKQVQAQEQIRQALALDPNLMDVHRVNAYVLETLGEYEQAIAEYEEAAKSAPNLTFLYIQIGITYRFIGSTTVNEEVRNNLYEQALNEFQKAVNIDEQLGINDPIPYLAIGKTYTQMGQFFVAARNVRKAVEFDPSNPDTYASLGIVYFKSRNFESAIPALKCAVQGCDAKESCLVREECDQSTPLEDIDPKIEIKALPLTTTTVVYYYTYGSVLAGMHRPGDKNNYCDTAVQVLGEVRDQYVSDPNIMSIVEASEQICASFGIRR